MHLESSEGRIAYLAGLLLVITIAGGCGGGAEAAQPGVSLTAGPGLLATPTNPITNTGTLEVDFAGTGTEETVARSDHEHAVPHAVALLAHDLPSATEPGPCVGLTWTTRTLNTEVYDPTDIVTLASNQFTLEPGTYVIEAGQTFAARVGFLMTFAGRIRNMTDDTTVGRSLNGRLQESVFSLSVNSPVPPTYVSLAAPTTFELQYFAQSADPADFGLGFAIGSLGTGEMERYAYVAIRRID